MPGIEYGSSETNLKIELLYDPAVPLLGVHPEKFKARSWRDVCKPVCNAALFTIAKRWEQPICV